MALQTGPFAVVSAFNKPVWDFMEVKDLLQKRLLFLFWGFFLLSGCGLGCRPDACDTAQVAMSELTPIALAIQSTMISGDAVPENLSTATGQELPISLAREAVLSQPFEKPSASYILTLSNSDESPVAYLVLEGKPNFSFEYYNRWGRDTCTWKIEKSDWLCFRR